MMSRETLTTLDPRALEQAIQKAFDRGIEWLDENPMDREYRFKAAADYADKTISALAVTQPQAGEPVPSGYGEFTPIKVGCSTVAPQPALAVEGGHGEFTPITVGCSTSLVASPPPSGGVEALRKLTRWAYDTLYEINPSNYDHDDVCKLNDASVEVILALAHALGDKCGKTAEWWAEYRKTHPLVAPATADGWRTMDGPVPTYECEFSIGQPVKMANPYAEDDPSLVFYVTGITWEYRMGLSYGWNITIASKDEIEKRHGATDGFAPTDLIPAAPTATGGR